MVVRNLDAFLIENQLQQTLPLSTLTGIHLVIEGNLWVKRLLTGTSREPSPLAMGGAPIGLESYIVKELNRFNFRSTYRIRLPILAANEIQVTFIFGSLAPIKKDKPFTGTDTRPIKRTQAWEAYEKGVSDQASTLWNNAATSYQPEVMNLVLQTLHENGVSFMRAPYSSWAQPNQIASMLKAHQFHAALAGSDLLMFGVDKLITAINFEAKEFAFFSKARILQELQVNADQFLDACVLAGFEYCATFPPISSEHLGFSFKAPLELVKTFKSGFNAIQSYVDAGDAARGAYLDAYCKTVCAIKYHPFLSSRGGIEPNNSETCPRYRPCPDPDFHTFMGHRLPDEVFVYMAHGLVSHHVPSALLSGVIVDSQPLCNGEAQEYRQLLRDLHPLRAQTLALLTRHLHGFFQSRKVYVAYWFEPKGEHPLLPYDGVQLPKCISAKWRCSQRQLDLEVGRQSFDGESELAFAIKASGSPKFLDLDEGARELLCSSETILTTALVRFLELRGLLNLPTSPYGLGLYRTVADLTVMPNDEMEGLIVAVELIRLGVLTNAPFTPEYADPYLAHIPEASRPHARLFSRVMCLIPMTFGRAPWSGPVDRNLLCFQSCVRIVTRTLRHMVEMVAAGILLAGECSKPRSDLFDLAVRLPFKQEPNTALAILAKLYLDRVAQHPPTPPAHWFEAGQLPRTFPCCSDPLEDIQRGFEFWDQLLQVLTVAGAHQEAHRAVIQQFLDADAWLKDKRV
ncbi:hypothetical protein L0F63_002803 [Massospora cicadina]|nr:hypothetical protein L0F63_002803 [Massospora cicadina]